jgi:uncharacterized membrane protein YGL010W
MKTLQAHLVNYAAYHRDLRNIHTHFVGIPLIVLAVAVLLACVPLGLGLSALHPVLLGAIVFYLRLDWGLGALMALLMLLAGVVCCRLGHTVCRPLVRRAQAGLCRRLGGFAGGAAVCGG